MVWTSQHLEVSKISLTNTDKKIKIYSFKFLCNLRE